MELTETTEDQGNGSSVARSNGRDAKTQRDTERAALIAQQSTQRCGVCGRPERYCQTDGQARGAHPFSPVLTCESCLHMGRRYWGSDDYPDHFCGKSGERRQAAARPSGDFATDFMAEFRKFYDASPKQTAEKCAFFEPRPLSAAVAKALPQQPRDPQIERGESREDHNVG